jgi:hypothetical protein
VLNGSGGSNNTLAIPNAFGSTTPDVGYYFEFPFSAFAVTCNGLGICCAGASSDNADTITVNISIDLFGWYVQ